MNRKLLVELSETVRLATHFDFRLGPPHTFGVEQPWYHQLHALDGSVQACFARTDAGFLVRFTGVADLHLDLRGQRIVCHADDRVPLTTIRHLVVDRVLPMLIGHLGTLVVHSSAVCTPHGTAMFVAPSGHGKSTLALSLCREDGCAALADDCLIVEKRKGEWQARSVYAGARLWPETIAATSIPTEDVTPVAHHTDKKRVALPHVRTRAPLAAIYFLEWLEPHAHVRLAAKPPPAAIADLSRSLFGLHLTDPDAQTRQYRQIIELVASVPVARLQVPRDIAQLPATRAAVLQHVLEQQRERARKVRGIDEAPSLGQNGGDVQHLGGRP